MLTEQNLLGSWPFDRLAQVLSETNDQFKCVWSSPNTGHIQPDGISSNVREKTTMYRF